jgi:excisionase family DNA binding protein
MSSSNQLEPVVTAQEAAGVLGLNPATIYTLIRQGELDAFDLGSRYRLLKESVSIQLGEITVEELDKIQFEAFVDLPAVLTTQETANLLRLSPDTVRRKARVELIPAGKLGRQWRFPLQQLKRKFTTPVSDSADA